MLHTEEEDEPCGKRQEVLDHGPHADTEDVLEGGDTKAREAVEGILAEVGLRERIAYEEHHGDYACQRGGEGGTSNAHAGSTEGAEDKHVVEQNVSSYHNDGVVGEGARVGRCHIEGAKHGTHHCCAVAHDAPIKVSSGGGSDGVRLNHQAHQGFAPEKSGARDDEREQEQEDNAVIEDAPYGGMIALTIAASHEDLCPRGKSYGEHKQGDVENAP